MKTKLILTLSVMVLVAFNGCSSSSGGSSSEDTVALAGLASCTAQDGSGVVCGTVLAADGVTPIANAEVEMVSASANVSALKGLYTGGSGKALTANSSACLTDDVGAFACVVATCAGSTTFSISSSYFGTPLEFTADCTAGEVTEVDTTDTTASSTQSAGVDWLVVPGSYDGIQLLLSQLKGCTLTGDDSNPASLSGSDECEAAGLFVLDSSEVSTFLADEDLSTFQAIFANCAADYSDAGGDVDTAVQAYVSNGGNMYFSDLADDWLTATFPGHVTFPVNKNSTSSGTMAAASVVDAGLGVFLGSAAVPQETLEVIFDLGVWTAMESVEADWTVYIEGDITPLSTIDDTAAPITVGGPHEDGCIFYTSYHIEGASTGSDQELALKYLLLNKINNCD